MPPGISAKFGVTDASADATELELIERAGVEVIKVQPEVAT